MDADVRRLAELVGDVERFASEHWGRRPLLRPSGVDLGRVLDVDAIERLLASGARVPTFRLVRDGSTLPADRSTATVRLGGRSVEGVADVERIATAVDEGATLVLQGLQRTSPPVMQLCRSLERAVSHPVQANAYLTPGGAQGLARHHDDHDVLVLQVTGTKAWQVDELGAVDTRPGDVLYIPARVGHEAAAQEGMSLHLTLGILRVTRAQILRRAMDRLSAVDGGRALPLGYARPEQAGELAAEVADAVAVASKALADVDVDELVLEERARARTRRPPVPWGRLRAVLRVDRLDATSVVARREGHPADLQAEPDDDGRLVLALHDRRLRLPAVAADAVHQLLTEPQVVVDQLRGIDPPSRLVLAERLVREGLLTVVPPGGEGYSGPTEG